MNLTIKATKFDLTESLRSELQEKLSSLESLLHPEDKLHMEVALETRHHQNGEIFRAEVRVSPDGLYAESQGQDVYEAIDLLIPKIRQQLVRQKDKKVSLRRKFGSIKWKFWEKNIGGDDV